MKKLLMSASTLALGLVLATSLVMPAKAVLVANPLEDSQNQAKGCTVETIGTKNGAHGQEAKFKIVNGVATTRFEVKGGPKCSKNVALKLYYTLTEGGLPREAQQQIKVKEGTFGVGVHRMAMKLPGACYYQLDLVNQSDRQANGKYQMLGYVLGGQKSCINTPETPEEPETPEVPETPQTPETPVTPATPQTPATELVKTGPASTAALFVGISAIAGIAYNIYKRRQLNA